MMGVLFGLGAAVIALVVIVAYMAGRIADLVDSNTVQHAKCTAHVADITSSRVVGLTLRHLAERLDSVDSTPDLLRLRRAHKDGDKSVTAMWLLEQAERIDPKALIDQQALIEYHTTDRTLSGEKI